MRMGRPLGCAWTRLPSDLENQPTVEGLANGKSKRALYFLTARHCLSDPAHGIMHGCIITTMGVHYG